MSWSSVFIAAAVVAIFYLLWWLYALEQRLGSIESKAKSGLACTNEPKHHPARTELRAQAQRAHLPARESSGDREVVNANVQAAPTDASGSDEPTLDPCIPVPVDDRAVTLKRCATPQVRLATETAHS